MRRNIGNTPNTYLLQCRIKQNCMSGSTVKNIHLHLMYIYFILLLACLQMSTILSTVTTLHTVLGRRSYSRRWTCMSTKASQMRIQTMIVVEGKFSVEFPSEVTSEQVSPSLITRYYRLSGRYNISATIRRADGWGMGA